MRRTEKRTRGPAMAANSPSSKQRSYKQTNALVVLLVPPLLTAYFTPNGRSQPPNGLGQKGRGILSQLVEPLHILGQNPPSLLAQAPPHARGKAGASVNAGFGRARKKERRYGWNGRTAGKGRKKGTSHQKPGASVPTLPAFGAQSARYYRRSPIPARDGLLITDGPRFPHRRAWQGGRPSCQGRRISASPHFGTKYPVPSVPGRPRGRGARS